MLLIVNQEHYDRVLAEVKAHPQAEVLLPLLEKQLNYLRRYGCGDDGDRYIVELGYDWAQWSFSISWKNRATGRFCFNGGLIFHPGSMGPDSSLSVELCPSAGPHWSIHT